MDNGAIALQDEKAAYTVEFGGVRRERIIKFRDKKKRDGVKLGSIQNTSLVLIDIALDKENC